MTSINLVLFEGWVYVALLTSIGLLGIISMITSYLLGKIRGQNHDTHSFLVAQKSMTLELLRKVDGLTESTDSIHHKLTNQRKREVGFMVETRVVQRAQADKLITLDATSMITAKEVKAIKAETVKANKNIQEVKTRLTWSRKRETKDLKAETLSKKGKK